MPDRRLRRRGRLRPGRLSATALVSPKSSAVSTAPCSCPAASPVGCTSSDRPASYEKSSRTASSHPSMPAVRARRASTPRARVASRSRCDPDYANSGRFVVFFARPRGDVNVVEYGPRAGLCRPRRGACSTSASAASVIQGGQLRYGPDGLLYASVGDMPSLRARAALGGGELYGGVPRPRRRRLDVVGYGLRNPWRFSFDRETGDLWMGDVGEPLRGGGPR